MKHVYYTPQTCPSKGTCHHEETSCPICDGGLSVCSVCGEAEGSLADECPGTRDMAKAYHDAAHPILPLAGKEEISRLTAEAAAAINEHFKTDPNKQRTPVLVLDSLPPDLQHVAPGQPIFGKIKLSDEEVRHILSTVGLGREGVSPEAVFVTLPGNNSDHIHKMMEMALLNKAHPMMVVGMDLAEPDEQGKTDYQWLLENSPIPPLKTLVAGGVPPWVWEEEGYTRHGPYNTTLQVGDELEIPGKGWVLVKLPDHEAFIGEPNWRLLRRKKDQDNEHATEGKHSVHCQSKTFMCPSCQNIKLVCQCCYVGGGSHYWSLQCPACEVKYDFDTYAFQLTAEKEKTPKHSEHCKTCDFNCPTCKDIALICMGCNEQEGIQYWKLKCPVCAGLFAFDTKDCQWSAEEKNPQPPTYAGKEKNQ